MKPLLTAIVFALAATLASGASAQDTSTAETSEFPIGTEPEIQVGQVYVVEKKGDWNVRCLKTEEGPEPCHIHQLLTDGDGNSVAELTFFHLPGGGPAVLGATATTPLGTALQSGVQISIDGGKSKQYPFNWCEGIGCISRMGFTGLELEMLKKGTQATLTIASITNPAKPIILGVSLKGFSDGFAAVLVKP